MEIEIKRIITITVLFVLAITCHAGVAPEPNEPNVVKAKLSTENTKVNTSETLVPEKQKPIDQIEAELAKEYYKDCVQNLKWALGIIIGLLVGFVGYGIFKSRAEYRDALADVKQALGDAREASREARSASDKAREYEEKAQERLTRIDETVGSKLKEIEEKGKTLITDLIQEGEKQSKINESWNEGLRAAKDEDFELAAKCFSQMAKDSNFENAVAYNNWGGALSALAEQKKGSESEALFRESFEKYEKAVQIRPNYYQVYNNWGIAFSRLAKRKEGKESEVLYRASFEKYEKSVQIRRDYHVAYNNWGIALFELGKQKGGSESEALFEESFKKYEKAVQIKPDYKEAYNNWANVLIELAKRKDAESRNRLLEKAKQKCLKAESIEKGSGAYNLACICALLGDEAECRKWLDAAHRYGILPTHIHIISDTDLESVRDKDWFKQILWP